MTPPRDHVKVLDSLRGIAALFVLLAHGISLVVEHSMDRPLWYGLEAFSYLGMTLFFLLSGFVIHYNYHQVEGFFTRRACGFFIARFARLYPLFLILFMAEMAFHYFTKEGALTPAFLFDPLSWFLTFTQTWFYIVRDGTPLWAHYWTVGGVSWSLSAEWFFYVIYAMAGFLLHRLTTLRGIVLTAICAYAFEASILMAGWMNHASVSAWGALHVGKAPDLLSLYLWLVYWSPIAHLGEFILGTLLAQLFRLWQHRRHTARELRMAERAAWGMALGIPLFYYALILVVPQKFSFIAAQLCAPLLAIFIFLLTQYRGIFLSRALCWKPLLILGESSYSLYLSHLFIITAIWLPLYERHGLALWCVYAGSVATALLWAPVSYRWIERPMKAWVGGALRRRLGIS